MFFMTSIRLVTDLEALWQVAASSPQRMSRTASVRAAVFAIGRRLKTHKPGGCYHPIW